MAEKTDVQRLVKHGGTPAEEWWTEIADLLHALGWSRSGERFSAPPVMSPTFQVLEQRAGASRTRSGMSVR